MKRRDVLIGALAAVAVGPRAATAQAPGRLYRLGLLSTARGPRLGEDALTATLTGLGYREGRNLMVERRYAAGDLARLPALAADLVRAKLEVIVTVTTPAALAAKQATTRIPIVMASGGDPVGSGLVASLARPGGNVTGTTSLDSLIDGKKVELLRELKPEARRLAFLGNSQIVAEQIGFQAVQATAKAFGMDAVFVNVPIPVAFDTAFATLAGDKVDVALVPPAAPNTDARSQIVAVAARYRLPTVYGAREFADAGGLISYGVDRASLFARAAVFVAKIFKGANPADLPVEQPRKIELVVNLKTARALGLTVPRSLRVRADEVIE
jgi:putative tryptophan/tyrosine transport system substrate-binding protein